MMKRWIWSALILIQMIAGCSSSWDNEAKGFIPGIYITAYDGNYSIGNDTIEIRQQGTRESNSYLVIKRNAYQRKENGRIKGDIHYKRSALAGSWDERTSTMIISNNGRILVFDPERNEMTIGITVYTKIKSL